MNTKELQRRGWIGCVVLWLAVSGFGQESLPENITVKLTDPSRPALVKVTVVNGSITVKGHDRPGVIVASDQSGLRVEESDNTVTVHPGHGSRVDLRLSVPVKSSLQLKSTSGGNILVENVEGEIEANGVNASVTLRKISGVVIAHSLQGRVRVQMDKVAPGKPMSFSALNGDVEVTLPADTRADIRMETLNGALRTDFAIPARVNSGPIVGKKLAGPINGGGPEIQLKTLNGSINLRKSERPVP